MIIFIGAERIKELGQPSFVTKSKGRSQQIPEGTCSPCGSIMYCTHLKTLQLVVMATLWVTPVRAGTDCRYGCRLNNMTITMEREDCHGSITVTTCAGLCETTDLNYQSTWLPRSQGVCNFKEWSYEKVYLEGCPSGVNPLFIPVAKSCDCIKCKTDNTDCDRISMATPSCIVNPLEM
ncbi:follitropin subunit beta [Oncorhynchus clarkii lewisi]|uniref:follitropin subunit beta n=1 Tax=Oncorhynchus clarkii lewisi TaxID=490388 RepID=UPI0039B8EA5E